MTASRGRLIDGEENKAMRDSRHMRMAPAILLVVLLAFSCALVGCDFKKPEFTQTENSPPCLLESAEHMIDEGMLTAAKKRYELNGASREKDIDFILQIVEERPALWGPFFEDRELNDNIQITLSNLGEWGESAKVKSLRMRHLLLAVKAGAMDEKMAGRLWYMRDEEFYIEVLSLVTTPDQYHVAKVAALNLISMDSDRLFPCIRRLQEIADGTASKGFDDSGRESLFKNFNTDTPSFTHGGTPVTDTNAAMVLYGSYDGETFTVDGFYPLYLVEDYDLFNINYIHRMPASPDEVSVFVCVSDSKEQRSTYVSEDFPDLSIPGMRYVVTILAVNAQEGRIYSVQPTVYGKDPPENKNVLPDYLPDAIIGSYPYYEVHASVGETVGLFYKRM